MADNFKLDVDADGIALITWDMPGRSMNVIDLATIEELSKIVEKIAADAAIKGAVITSGKETFCAGADLTLLDTLTRTFKDLAKDKGEEAAATVLFAESRKLSQLYRRIETCGKPFAAAINGTALGGGFELCLACHQRIASDNAKTRLGLPEVKIGLFPGAGGTQRIARMMAPADALQFLLKGDQLNLTRAKTMKLVDAVVPAADLVKAAKDWVKANGKAKAPWDVDGFRLPGGQVYSRAGMMTFPAANAIYRRETFDNYPAARAIMQVVYEGLLLPMDRALTVESRHFTKVLRSPEAAAMIRSLFVSLQDLSKGARRPANVPQVQIKKVGILGAGFMGAGIASVSAQAGLEVVLIDRDQDSADKGKAHVHKGLTDQINRGRGTAAQRDAVLARITATADYAALAGVDLIVEAVFEDRKVKAEATAKAQAVVPDVIFGSNTSTLPITSLAESAKDPAKFVGIHFFSPVERMMLVEIIVGKKTGDAALAMALDFVRAIRKTPIVVNDSRGFYTSRVVGTYLREGHLMLAEGVPAAMIENVGRMAGMPVGPLSLNDEVAVDLAWKIVKATEADLGCERHRSAAEGDAGAYGREARPARPQERQGLLRLSREGAEEAVARPRRDADEKARSRQDRRAGDQGPAAGDAGAGDGALLRGGRAHRRARGRRRLDPGLRLCAVFRRHAVLHRHDGRQAFRRAVPAPGEEIRRALCAVEAAARHGRRRAKVSMGASRPERRRRNEKRNSGSFWRSQRGAVRGGATPSLAQDYAAIIAAPDRADADRQTDQRRDPVKLLTFTGVKTGMTVLDMGAGGGYSTELMARAVGPTGKVYGQDYETAARAKERFEARMKTDAMKNVMALARPFDDPLPAEVEQSRSHHVLLLLSRHHLHDGRSRRDEQEAVRRAQARRLLDHRRSFGQAGAGTVGRQDLASDRGERAAERGRGGRLQACGQRDFLRHPEDPRDERMFQPKVPVDEFVLKFQKPN